MLKHKTSVIVLIISAIIISACNSTKYVPEGSYMLSKNKFEIDGKKNKSEPISDFVIQRPNSRFLGLLFPLWFYNLGNEDYQESYETFIKNNTGHKSTLNKIFSEKQTYRIGETYKSLNKWFIEGGQAPVLLDESKAALTARKLRNYYFNNGYFNAQIDYRIELKVKKVHVIYEIEKNNPFRIDSIKTSIDSKILDSIYLKNKDKSFIKEGSVFKDQKFRKEADRLTRIFRNSGIYNFTENQISFQEIDTLAKDFKTDVVLKITDRLVEKNGEIITEPHRIQKISKINIFTDYSYEKKDLPLNDTITFKGYNFYSHDKSKYYPKSLLNAIFIEPGSIYKDSTRSLTRRHLKLMKNFKLVKLNYKEINKDELEATILLSPMKKYSISMNTEVVHSNIKQLGFAGGFSIINRNTFKNAEIFKLTFKGSIFDVAKNLGEANDRPFSSWEISADASLEVPKIVIPFGLESLVSKKAAPKTLFSLGSSFQKNIGLDKQKITLLVDYSWTPNKKEKHTIEPINIQYVKNLNKDQYFYIYSSQYQSLQIIQQEYYPNYPLTPDNALQFIKDVEGDLQTRDPEAYQIAKNIEKRNKIITTDFVIPAITYTYHYTTKENINDKKFFFFRARIATAGNIFTALSRTQIDGVKTFLDTPIAQYVKTDFEYIKYWQPSKKTVLVSRTFVGAAVPYGNSTDIPFTSSYFIGGSSDIRAYRTYELGPGSNDNGLEYNVGSLKLITNLEYRFGITKSFKGALFIDAGNIWDITNSDISEEGEKFTSLASLKNAAIGTGFGLRYDFNFFVFRTDLGFKTYEPYLPGNRWFQNYDFTNAVINIGINYPF